MLGNKERREEEVEKEGVCCDKLRSQQETMFSHSLDGVGRTTNRSERMTGSGLLIFEGFVFTTGRVSEVFWGIVKPAKNKLHTTNIVMAKELTKHNGFVTESSPTVPGSLKNVSSVL